MHLSGQTPLFRAKNLEKYLNVQTIYLKLEGTNPTGHKNDRIAEAMVKYAKSQGYDSLFVHGSERYLKSIEYFAASFGLSVHAPVVKGETPFVRKYPEVVWHTIKVQNADDAIDCYEEFAKQHHHFFLSEWERVPFIRELAIQGMMEEAFDKVKEPQFIWTQIKGAYTLKSIYHESVRHWVKGAITSLPEIYCGLDERLTHAIEEQTPIKGYTLRKINRIRDAIEATNARPVPVSESDIKEAIKLLKKLENISVSPKEAYPLAAFLASKEVLQGVHVIFLNDGKSDIRIQEVSKESSLDLDAFVEQTRTLLEPYHDSVEETKDAILKAIECGFIFTATRQGMLQGICIVVHMGFQTFIPTYHLAYIGVKAGNAGRGLATELMNEAIEKTKGNLSLHVDMPNRRAKKLYEKMGFQHCYDRMIYKG